MTFFSKKPKTTPAEGQRTSERAQSGTTPAERQRVSDPGPPPSTPAERQRVSDPVLTPSTPAKRQRVSEDNGEARQLELGTTPLDPGLWKIDREDAVDWLSKFPSESVDLIVTDPAYESLEKHRAKGTTTRLKVSDGSSNEWFPIFPNSRFPDLFRQLYRVLKPNTHCYVMCDQETMFVAKPIGEEAGFKFWKPLIWDKGKIGMGYHYRSRYEMILFFEKGKRKLSNLAIPDVLNVPRGNGSYPTEKPYQLARIFIEQSSMPGELVIDPFCGSASTGAAALYQRVSPLVDPRGLFAGEGRRFFGCDISEKAAEVSRARLASITATDPNLQVSATRSPPGGTVETEVGEESPEHTLEEVAADPSYPASGKGSVDSDRDIVLDEKKAEIVRWVSLCRLLARLGYLVHGGDVERWPAETRKEVINWIRVGDEKLRPRFLKLYEVRD